MSVSSDIFERIRERASKACEYCGITEVDSGGLLTVDHFQPRAHSGTDSLDNLVYACFRCNGYKHAYWGDESTKTHLWNPRIDPVSTHFLELEDGNLIALTDVGRQTIKVLRLNRPLLVEYRRTKQRNRERDSLLARITEVVQLRHQAELEQIHVISEQTELLEDLRDILKAIERLDP